MPLILQSPGPLALKIGTISVRWYGVLIAGGFLVSTWLASRLAKQRQIESESLINFFLICFLSGILGARLYFVALNWQNYLQHPAEILATWLGGMSIHGGLLGGFLGGYLYAGWKKLPRRDCADIVACMMPVGQAIGRWGNFFNSEAFGTPVPQGFPVAVLIPAENRPAQFQSSELFHATFLYESIWNLAAFLLLYFVLFNKLKRWPGVCFLIYLIIYSVGRLLIEPIRTDSIMAGATPVPIIASAVTALVAAALIPVLMKMAPSGPKDSQEPSGS